MSKVLVYTLGFTKKNAKTFFNLIKKNNVQRIIDVRLNNVSQLAGFAKRDDLIFFLKELCQCDYLHLPLMAPTKSILDDYKNKKIDWAQYVQQFTQLIEQRKIENLLSLEVLNGSCFLCSEVTAEKCHRRLVAEFFKNQHPEIQIKHL